MSNRTDIDSISLEWTIPVGSYKMFTLEWRRAGSTDKWSSGRTTEKTFTISGLTAGTEYDITISAWRSANATGVSKTAVIALKTKSSTGIFANYNFSIQIYLHVNELERLLHFVLLVTSNQRYQQTYTLDIFIRFDFIRFPLL